ncbi:beta-ketoacyl synthase N-terminal-like domain-containing protein, partial [Streptomyces sp. NPDC046465]|uniref:type I polyketide synthase n=1 Tax=Streptomyces sp. NPDC046465 TaxID=3155810 RepID=UPI0033FFA4A6
PTRPTAHTTHHHNNLTHQLTTLTPTDQEKLLIDIIGGEAMDVLGVDVGDLSRDGRGFSDLGFDSLTAVELRNRLSTATSVKLPATLIFDYPTPKALARHLRDELSGQTTTPATAAINTPALATATDDDPIAIVGMACRLPGGVAGPEDLWQMVSEGRDGMSDFPTDRGWNLDGLLGSSDPDQAGTSYVQQGGFLHEAGRFDAGFFGISPREATAMDPQQRLLLETSWEVFERAGIDPTRAQGSNIGVFSGVSIHDYLGALEQVPEEFEGFATTAIAGSVASGRVSYVFGFEGPAVTVDTACSSSLVAIHLAAQALRQGECTMALAGGVAVMGSPAGVLGFSRQRGLAADGRIKAFSSTADGTVLSEGVGVVLLERLSEARKNGHTVLAVVRGSAINQDGASNGLTAPNGPAQQRVIRKALANARLTTSDIDMVEAHGTGTTLGDPIEAQALLATYGQDRAENQPLWLGSLKSNIGHAQAAAGVASVIKMVESMQHGVLPATLHVDEPTSQVDWTAGAVELLTEARPWPETEHPRRAGISSFGVSGTNAHLILEQAPQEPSADHAAEPLLVDDEAPLPFVVSAKSAGALAGQAQRLATYVETNENIPLAGIAASLLSDRALHTDRAVVVAASREELLVRLRTLANGEPGPGATAGTRTGTGKLVVVFPGQGAQRAGMGRELYDRYPVFAAALDEVCAELDDRLAGWVSRPIRELVFATEGSTEAQLLDQTVYTQAALFAVETALFRLVASWGVRPDVVMGHSIGEISAAHAAGMLSLKDAATLVAARGRLMQPLPTGGAMVAVAAGEDEVRALLTDGVDIAAVNGPASVVLSGDETPVLELADTLRAAGRKVKRLAVSHAFHSARMDAMLDEFAAELAAVEWQPANIPVVSNVTGQVVEDDLMRTADYWVEHVRRPVLFAAGAQAALDHGGQVFLELGPGAVLTGLVRELTSESPQAADAVCVAAMRDGRDEAQTLLGSLAEAFVRGADVDWTAALPTGAVSTEAVDGPRVALPTYAFDQEHYWLRTVGAPSDATSLGLSAAGHPLLGAKVDVPSTGGLLYTSRLSLRTHPWLADHAVQGVVLIPGAAYVDLAIRAGDEFGCGVLDELVIDAPLVLPEEGSVRVQVAVGGEDEQGRRSVGVYSSRGDVVEGGGQGGQEWTRHASGVLSPVAPVAPVASAGAGARYDFGQWPPAGAEPVDITGFYEDLTERG